MVAEESPCLWLGSRLDQGIWSLGGNWLLTMLPQQETRPFLGVILQKGTGSPIPAEFKHFFHLFEPNTKVLSPNNNKHTFRFSFKKGAKIPRGCPIYPQICALKRPWEICEGHASPRPHSLPLLLGGVPNPFGPKVWWLTQALCWFYQDQQGYQTQSLPHASDAWHHEYDSR